METIVQDEEFEKAALCQKVNELLDSYGLTALDVNISIGFDIPTQKYNLEINRHYEMSEERLARLDGRLEKLREGLGATVEDTKPLVISKTFDESFDLYDALCDAIDKAPRSMTRYTGK